MRVVCSVCGHGPHRTTYSPARGQWTTACRVVDCGCATYQPTVVNADYAEAIRNPPNRPSTRPSHSLPPFPRALP